MKKNIYMTYLVDIDTVIKWPRGLEVILHPLLELLGDLMESQEVFQIPPLGVVQGSPGVHPLDNRRHVSEDHRMHQR